MEQKAGAQTFERRDMVASFDREFARLHFRSTAIIESTPASLLYSVNNQSASQTSTGERVLRSAAAIEQTFGGIASNLWDDPFEWTLPEQLSTPASVLAHLADVESTRRNAFTSFTDDSCLLKSVATPGDGLVTLVELLLKTLSRANYCQSQAVVLLEALSGIRPSGFII